MEISVTKFRSNLFELVNRAFEGAEIWVTHKGQRFKLVPEKPAGSRLSRITPLEVINPHGPDLDDPGWKNEMRLAWESDWDKL